MMQAKSAKVPLSGDPAALMKEAYDLDDLIKIAYEEVAKLQQRRDVIMEELLTNGIREAGQYAIEDRVRTVRKVNVGRLMEQFPVAYKRICEVEREKILKSVERVGKSILIKDAEKFLGEADLGAVCDLDSSVTHVIKLKDENSACFIAKEGGL